VYIDEVKELARQVGFPQRPFPTFAGPVHVEWKDIGTIHELYEAWHHIIPPREQQVPTWSTRVPREVALKAVPLRPYKFVGKWRQVVWFYFGQNDEMDWSRMCTVRTVYYGRYQEVPDSPPPRETHDAAMLEEGHT